MRGDQTASRRPAHSERVVFMGFVFRFERVEQWDQGIVLTGQMLRGELGWAQRVEIHAEEEARTLFSGPLRGVALVGMDDEQSTVMADFACWENSYEFPKATKGEQQFRLILHGMPSADLPLHGIAWGVDEKSAGTELTTAVQTCRPEAVAATPLDAGPAAPARVLGVPLREYPYQIDRRRIILFAPWFMFLTVTILLVVAAVALWNRNWDRVNFMKWSSFALFGLVDVFLLYLSVKMLFAERSQIIVTATGIVLPIFSPDFSIKDLFLPFADMHGILEYWHKDSVRLIKLKTVKGIFLINVFLMNRCHFEELRRILWHRLHEASGRQDDHSSGTLPDPFRLEQDARFAKLLNTPPPRISS
jgi:hypothetical protein